MPSRSQKWIAPFVWAVAISPSTLMATLVTFPSMPVKACSILPLGNSQSRAVRSSHDPDSSRSPFALKASDVTGLVWPLSTRIGLSLPMRSD